MNWISRVDSSFALRVLLPVFLLFLSPVSALSQTLSNSSLDSLQQLTEAVVIADRNGDKVIPAQVLSGTELRKLNALSVADAIRYFSGVQIKDYGGIGGLKTINVRSMGSQHVGVFFDGIQLGNAQNGQIDLGKFSLDNMESVSLYNGQKASSVQSAKDYASASAVYLRTRTPVFEDGRRRNIKFSLSGGSFLTINPSVLWEEKIGKNISNSFSAEYLYTTGKYKFSYTKAEGYDTTAVRQNGDVSALRIENGLFGNIKDGNWKVKLYFYDSERGYPGAFVREEPGKFKHEDRQWDTDFFAQGSLFKELFPWYKLSVNGKYAYDYLHYLSDPRLDVTTMYVDNHYYQQEAYVSAAQEFKLFKWWDVDLAADYQFNTLDADLIDFVYPSRHTLLAALSTSFRFGVVNLQGSVLYTFVDDNAKKVGAAAEKKSIFTPTAVIQYKPFRKIDLSFRAFYKKIFRMPTLNDLYYTFIGNKYLKPEYTTQYNAGATYDKKWKSGFFRGVDFSTDFYFNQVKDKIIAMPTSNQFQWTMVNLGYVEIRGVDVAFSTQMKAGPVGASLRLTYTYQMAQDFTNPESEYYGGQIPYIPWNSGSAILGLDYNNWSFNYCFIYTGERYESVANIPENYAQPWYTSDLALSARFPISKKELAATLELNNIFNQQYEVVQCYPMPGINFRIKIVFTI